MSAEVHPTAVVDPGAQLGADVIVGPYCIIENHVIVGDGCVLEAHVHLKRYTRMGENNVIGSHACLGGEPQHSGFKGEETWAVLGNNNRVREYVTIHRGTVTGGGETSIGSNCMLMAYCHIAHDCKVGDNVIIANVVQFAGHVEVGNNVIISGMTAIQQFTRIGDYAFLGGLSGVSLDVAPYMLAHGNPGKVYSPNFIGLRRHGFTSETCSALKKAFKIIFRSGLRREEALEQVAAEVPDLPEVLNLVDFINSSKNGITPAATKNGNGSRSR